MLYTTRIRFFAAGLVVAGLLLQGCATTRLQPNRRLAPDETVVTPSVTLTSFGYPARVGLGVASGGQDGELLFDAGLTWIGLEMGAGVELVGPSSDYSPLPLMLQLGIAVHFGSGGRMPSPPGAGAVRADR